MKWLFLFLLVILGYQYFYLLNLYKVPDFEFSDIYKKPHNFSKKKEPQVLLFINSNDKEAMRSLDILKDMKDTHLDGFYVNVFVINSMTYNDLHRLEKQYPKRFIFFKGDSPELIDILKKYFTLKRLGDIFFTLPNKKAVRVNSSQILDERFKKDIISKIELAKKRYMSNK